MANAVAEILARVVVLRDTPVIPAAMAAELFGVETREVVQAIKRNPKKFSDIHAFEATSEEADLLRSQGVISNPRRGGSRAAPWLLTQKGVMRLATVLNTPRALDATDLMIDVFTEVHAQLRAGATSIQLANPARLTPGVDRVDKAATLRTRLLDSLDSLLTATIDTRRQRTVADELGDFGANVLSDLRARLRSRELANEKLSAETLLILEQSRDLAERREVELRQSHAETERTTLQNVLTKIDIVEKLLELTQRLEPNAVLTLLPTFDTPEALEAPTEEGSN